MPKVSILVPIYNVEKYLTECLESIVKQTLTDIEIICINDGSTDNSLNIIQNFAKQDTRIKIIDKENSGYGASMNLGLQKATGEYIGIVESDDFVKPEMFEELYSTAIKNNAELVKSDYYDYLTSKKQARRVGIFGTKKTNKVISIKDDVTLLKIIPSIWTGLYKRTFLENNKINFLETPGASYQDTSFAFKAIALAERIVLLNKAFLFYRNDNENSSVNSKDKVYAIDNEFDEITKFLNKNAEIKQLANDIKLIKEYKTYIWNFKRIDEKYREDFVAKLSSRFTIYYNNGEITKEFYKKIAQKEFLELLKSPKMFLDRYKKVVDREKNIKERQKQFSIRINRSRISIILFGKQVVEIG